MRLKGQVAVVTGGSQGIGEALAKRYAAEGAKVAILNRNEAKAQSVVRAIQSAAAMPPHSGPTLVASPTSSARLRASSKVRNHPHSGQQRRRLSDVSARRNQRTGGRCHAERQR